jgi:phage-related minor tail protein
MDLATLSISVTSNGVQTAARGLEALGKAAANADIPIRNVAGSLSYMKNQDVSSFVTSVKSLNEALRSGKGGFSDFVTSASSLTRVSTSFTAVANAADKLAGNVAGLTAVADQLARIQSSLEAMKGSASVVTRISGGGTPRSSGSSGGSTMGPNAPNEVSAYTQKQNILLSQLEREAYLVNHTKAEWLEYRAAKLGVAAAATPYIEAMKGANNQTQQFGMSTKATAAAMRMVPAQFTDIVTQLAGGQNPMLIMIQQGGQLRDMFQGFGPMFQAVGGMITKFLLNPITLITGAIATLGYALYAGGQEAVAFGLSIAKTNGILGVTKSQMVANAEAANGLGVGQGKAAEAMLQFSEAGVVSNKTYGELIQTATEYSKVFGVKLNTVIKDYIGLNEKASDQLVEQDRKYNFLTVSIYNKVKALEAEGRQLEAVKIANDAIAEAQKRATSNAVPNIGLIERAWNGVWSSLVAVKDAILDIGRDTSDEEKLATMGRQLAAFRIAQAKAAKEGKVLTEGWDTKQLAAEYDKLKNKIFEANKAAEDRQKEVMRNKELVAAMQKYDSIAGAVLTKDQALNKLAADKAAIDPTGKIKGEVYWMRVREGILRQYETQAGKKADKEEDEYQTLLKKAAVEKASLSEQAASYQSQIDALAGKEQVVAKTNSHLNRAAELEEKANQATDFSTSVLYKKMAANEREVGLLQQQLSIKEQQAAADKKIADEKERAKKALEAQQKADVADLRKVNPFRAIQEDEAGQLATLNRYQAELEAFGMFENMKTAITQQANQKRLEAAEQMYIQMSMYNKILMSSVNAVGASMTSNITGLITGTTTLTQVMQNLGNTILNSVVGAIVQWGIEEVKRIILGETMRSAAAAATLAEAVAIGAAWDSAALAASIATMGVAASTGFAAYVAAKAANFMGPIPMKDNGGYISAGQTSIVGEYGPELVNGPAHITSRRETAKMMGGNSGPVNVQLINNTSVKANATATQDSSGNLRIVLEEILPDMIANQAGNPASKMNKALSGTYRMQRA